MEAEYEKVEFADRVALARFEAEMWMAAAAQAQGRGSASYTGDLADRMMSEFRRRFMAPAAPLPTRPQRELAVAREYECPVAPRPLVGGPAFDALPGAALPAGGRYQLAYVTPGGEVFLIPGAGHDKYAPGQEGKYGLIFSTKKQFHPGEPVFILRATDPDAPSTLLDYVARVSRRGCTHGHLQAALGHYERMLEWQGKNSALVKARAD
jgi:hypothetical protein